MKTTQELTAAMQVLKNFVGSSQWESVAQALRGEEAAWFQDRICALAQTVATLPKTYEQEGQGHKAIIHLHYFIGGCDWYITEQDIEAEQHQAFGLADLGYGAELGYISIIELLDVGAELDFYWTPKTVGQIQEKQTAPQCVPSSAPPHKHALWFN